MRSPWSRPRPSTKATRTVRLNTVLAHSSGEWIASDWPVCPLNDINSPQRMGAALTYARRYAMFTLVGIAGEDDLDAPDLNVSSSGPTSTEASATSSVALASKPRPGNGHAAVGFPRGQSATVKRPILAADESARLREGMLAEIESIGSSGAAIAWANTMLRAIHSEPSDSKSRRAVASSSTAPSRQMASHCVLDGRQR